jgi:hypothetical protein
MTGYGGQNGERGVYIRWANITAAPSIFLQDRQHCITSPLGRDIASLFRQSSVDGIALLRYT